MKKVAAVSGRMEEIMKTTTNFRTGRMVQLALFTAIIAILNLTPLGYINTPPLAITLVGIPVIIGAIVLGPASGAFLGVIFGLTSFIRCFGIDPTGVLVLGIDPVKTFIMCLLPRILMGWLTGLTFQGLKRIDKKRFISYAVTSLLGSLYNTVLFMAFFILFFINNSEFQKNVPLAAKGAITFFLTAAGFNAILEAIVCLIIGTAVSKALNAYAAAHSH